MPAVRIELGYLTSPRDAARLADPGFRDVVAEAIARGDPGCRVTVYLDAPPAAVQPLVHVYGQHER